MLILLPAPPIDRSRNPLRCKFRGRKDGMKRYYSKEQQQQQHPRPPPHTWCWRSIIFVAGNFELCYHYAQSEEERFLSRAKSEINVRSCGGGSSSSWRRSEAEGWRRNSRGFMAKVMGRWKKKDSKLMNFKRVRRVALKKLHFWHGKVIAKHLFESEVSHYR